LMATVIGAVALWLVAALWYYLIVAAIIVAVLATVGGVLSAVKERRERL
jgi:hypothetical protein